MTLRINKDVVRLDISMNVVHAVHIFKSQQKFSDIEASFLLAKNVLLDQKSEEITSWNPLHGDIEVIDILEGWL